MAVAHAAKLLLLSLLAVSTLATGKKQAEETTIDIDYTY